MLSPAWLRVTHPHPRGNGPRVTRVVPQYEVGSYVLDWCHSILYDLTGLSEEAQALGRYGHEDVVLETLQQVCMAHTRRLDRVRLHDAACGRRSGTVLRHFRTSHALLDIRCFGPACPCGRLL